MLRDNKTPRWLIDVQNKSWEPEILISGITLTTLFLLSSYLYNLSGMLIQEYDVTTVTMHIFYGITTMMLTGLKIVLIAHLILRGLWTGLVGLSYVYPRGIRRHRLSPADQKLDFASPLELVIRVEKVCSVLFAFIFSSFSFFISMLMVYIPSILLRLIIVDRIIYFYANLCYLLIILPFCVVLIQKRPRFSKFNDALKIGLFTNIFCIFMSNIGRYRMRMIFAVYFLIIIGLSISDILAFGFWNTRAAGKRTEDVVFIDASKYESDRDIKLRIEKATVGSFHVDEDRIRLFVSYYKGDEVAFRNTWKHRKGIAELYSHISPSTMRLPDLYRVLIDTTVIHDVPWYRTRVLETGQQGYVATIDIDTIPDGYHELRIDKIVWRQSTNEPRLVEYWDLIPFEKRTQ